jgi:hypothetical protein
MADGYIIIPTPIFEHPSGCYYIVQGVTKYMKSIQNIINSVQPFCSYEMSPDRHHLGRGWVGLGWVRLG